MQVNIACKDPEPPLRLRACLVRSGPILQERVTLESMLLLTFRRARAHSCAHLATLVVLVWKKDLLVLLVQVQLHAQQVATAF